MYPRDITIERVRQTATNDYSKNALEIDEARALCTFTEGQLVLHGRCLVLSIEQSGITGVVFASRWWNRISNRLSGYF